MKVFLNHLSVTLLLIAMVARLAASVLLRLGKMEHCEECGSLKCARMNAESEVRAFRDWIRKEAIDTNINFNTKKLLKRYLDWVAATDHKCPMPYKVCKPKSFSVDDKVTFNPGKYNRDERVLDLQEKLGYLVVSKVIFDQGGRPMLQVRGLSIWFDYDWIEMYKDENAQKQQSPSST
jgi:hypothetical protein